MNHGIHEIHERKIKDKKDYYLNLNLNLNYYFRAFSNFRG